MQIRNRILETRLVAPDEVAPNTRNWRTHPQAQRDALRGVLADIGIAAPVIAYHSARVGGGLVLIDGHERMTVGVPFPCAILDVSDAEADTLLATFDPLGAMAETDGAALDALLRDVSTDSPAVQAMLDELAQAAGIVPGVEVGGGGDEFDATPEDGPTRCQSGDLWSIGGVHRLIIGDSTDAATVARLMQGERARFEFADPPYELGDIGGGIVGASAYRRDLRRAGIDTFSPASLTMIAPTAVFCCNKPLVPAYLDLARTLCVSWDICCYAKKNTPPNYGGHMMTDVEYLMLLGNQSPINGRDKAFYSKVYIGGLDADAAVAWQKPLGLVEKFITIYSEPGELIADRFFGSGTTLIAAHRTGRRCYGIEIAPKYGDVILRRAEAEGLACERIEGGA